MPRLYLVRHARPATGWGEDVDPGLDDAGVAQARICAEALKTTTQRLPVYTSPMRRCRETAAPLTALWHSEAHVLPAVAEIPAPDLDATARRAWLNATLHGTWAQMYAAAPSGSIDYAAWRRSIIDALLAMEHDCVIYTHYIAINVGVGAATRCEDVLCFRPDHASVTILDVTNGRLQLVERGREAATSVLTRN